jgi:hypothetical protein
MQASPQDEVVTDGIEELRSARPRLSSGRPPPQTRSATSLQICGRPTCSCTRTFDRPADRHVRAVFQVAERSAHAHIVGIRMNRFNHRSLLPLPQPT